MQPGTPTLIVISPIRDEAQTIRGTIATMLAQSLRPARWVIVDDGSHDETYSICHSMVAKLDFVQLIRLTDRGTRQPGPGVVHAFEAGLRAAADLAWDFVAKLDGDVLLPTGYYATLLRAFAQDSSLGICSGACLTPDGREFRLERSAPFHTRGPCKMYRRHCFKAIGGLEPMLGWDGLDGYKARKKGWTTRTLEELLVIHQRPTHSIEGSFRGAMRAGRGAYNLHYRWPYLMARAGVNLFRPPYLLSGLGMAVGYWMGHWRKLPRLCDPPTVDFIRHEQNQRLAGLWKRWL